MFSSVFNGYVLRFETDCALFEGVSIDTAFTTMPLTPAAKWRGPAKAVRTRRNRRATRRARAGPAQAPRPQTSRIHRRLAAAACRRDRPAVGANSSPHARRAAWRGQPGERPVQAWARGRPANRQTGWCWTAVAPRRPWRGSCHRQALCVAPAPPEVGTQLGAPQRECAHQRQQRRTVGCAEHRSQHLWSPRASRHSIPASRARQSNPPSVS